MSGIVAGGPLGPAPGGRAGAPAPRLRGMPNAPLDTSSVDLATLRAERLTRMQAAMRDAGADVALFFMPGNIRYATGTAIMTVYSMSASVRCAVVPAEG